ncbi:MAG: hypothetical protein ACHQLA_08795 [Ignavibacteriales bacterium]
MNRKKFFALFSTGIAGIAILKSNPLRLFRDSKNQADKMNVKLNPDAVKRDKPGKKNG